MTPISIFLLISLLESSNHQDEEHSLIARYAARLAADAAVRYLYINIYQTFIAHNIMASFNSVQCQKSVLDERSYSTFGGFQAIFIAVPKRGLKGCDQF